jgi:putative transposase
MRFAFIEAHRVLFHLEIMRRVLKVSRSGSFDWRGRQQHSNKRVVSDSSLTGKIKMIHQRSRGRYGAPRVHAELREEGVRVGRKRVARLMRSAGLHGKGKHKYRVTTKAHPARPVAENVLDRQFKAERPDTVYASDITYLYRLEGWLYLAVVLNVFSRRVVGWSMSERITDDLTLRALEMALTTRNPEPGWVHHSDRGSQYTSWADQKTLSNAKAISSMSRKGNGWDNAVVESFFASLKAEGVDGRVYATRLEARTAMFEFIEVFYNRQRRHSSLGFVSPARFEELRLAA